jgi:hypothetical protein
MDIQHMKMNEEILEILKQILDVLELAEELGYESNVSGIVKDTAKKTARKLLNGLPEQPSSMEWTWDSAPDKTHLRKLIEFCKAITKPQKGAHGVSARSVV